MKKYKIDGCAYDLVTECDSAPDGYALNGKMWYAEPAKGHLQGYATMSEGSVIACYTQLNLLRIVIPIATVILLLTAAAVYILLNQEQDIAIGDTMLRTSVDKNIVIFNGIMAYNNGEVDIRFENGDYETTLTLTGDGIEPTAITVSPKQTVYSIPVAITSDMDVLSANLRFETATSTSDFAVLIEIPGNMTGTTGISSYFEGEGVISE